MSDQLPKEIANRIEVIEAELTALKERNQRVESDKAWETSQFRTLFLTGATYVVTAIIFLAIGAHAPLLNALIPTIGYFTSTQTVPALKRRWLAQRRSK